ncbi:metallophosphoesterase family protein [Streptomyces halstedii]|uniref:metallophosphoesterase family protein n=1 Tax=Streptomyces TaxID=1883 RepID=UPI00048F6A37|nr:MULTISPECIES: metallophosphoesterase [unclassified Streptomyces]MYY16224.1 metallophosphoesterase [Streptomyces sp. SID4912]SCD31575.1 3',5'-cyclic AMP phosphodiesterase CpdA [Streptomyces sp. PpalLS-921]SCD42893.1 3',5'-cyclic AMP phosphodiesterase CpdA [Streptomyces sp. DpondAA-D4]
MSPKSASAPRPPDGRGRLLAVSDLHVGIADNKPVADRLRPTSDADWLIVAGDVAEQAEEVERALETLAGRFAHVVWTPGNHELWTLDKDPVRLRGQERYEHLVRVCRELGVTTPEDPYPRWQGEGEDGPVAIAPVFLLYDYTFRAPGTSTKEESLARAHEAGVVCTDEFLLHPDPYPSRDAWCRARVALTERRLAAHDPEVPLVIAGHWPLVREPTSVMWYPEFAQWCGTELTADWHRRFNVAAVVYGHLHIPRTTWYDGVRFEEVSLGYPREWRKRGHPRGLLRQILPYDGSQEAPAVTEGAS